MSDHRIRITRRFTGNWEVRCQGCERGMFAGFLPPWIEAKDQPTALVLAGIYTALHFTKTCACCGHVADIPRAVVIDKDSFKVGAAIYARGIDGKFRPLMHQEAS